MRRNKQNRELDRLVAGAKALLAIIILFAIASGGLQDLGGRVIKLTIVLVLLGIMGACLYALVHVIKHTDWNTGKLLHPKPVAKYREPAKANAFHTQYKPPPVEPKPQADAKPVFTAERIRERLPLIDWYQFEKFCSALLQSEGFHVHRSGGARPDGGVDLIAVKDNEPTLVQCKHWRNWKIKEPTVREMLGSMTDFKVTRGAIYTLNGWTLPAAEFAAKHGIKLVDDNNLAERAARGLSQGELEEELDADKHRCPKCESAMVEREGPNGRFWGCAAFPRCRTTMKKLGAR